MHQLPDSVRGTLDDDTAIAKWCGIVDQLVSEGEPVSIALEMADLIMQVTARVRTDAPRLAAKRELVLSDDEARLWRSVADRLLDEGQGFDAARKAANAAVLEHRRSVVERPPSSKTPPSSNPGDEEPLG